MGIQTSEGIVLAVEKRVQSLLIDSDSIEKIMEIDSHVGCAMSGLTADARTMVEHARVTAQVSLSIIPLLDIGQSCREVWCCVVQCGVKLTMCFVMIPSSLRGLRTTISPMTNKSQ